MAFTMTSIVLVLSLLMGSAGVTVYAAQDSLPNQALYEVKTLSEDIAIYLPLSDAEKLELELNYASRRVDEIASMVVMGLEPPEYVLSRLEKHLDQAIRLTLNIRERDMMKVLLRIRERLGGQEEKLNEVLQATPAIRRAREAIQTRLRWAEFGLNDPNTFREQARIQNHYNQPPDSNGSYGSGRGNDGYGPGPHSTRTPTPGNGYGPDMDKDDKSPGNGTVPYITGTPTPGSGYGLDPGPDPSSTCTPGAGLCPNPDTGSPGKGQNDHQGPDNGSGKTGGPRN